MSKGRSGKLTMQRRERGATRGFSLIELLVTLVVMAVLATLALPSFREFIAAQRVKTASFDVMSMLTLTRSEAIKRNSEATLSGLATGNLRISAGGTLVQQREPISGLVLSCKSGGATVACIDVVYTANGRLQDAVPSIEISSAATAQRSCIRIDPSGRANSTQGGC